MSRNFEDALNIPASDIERPPLLPPGTYVWMVEKQPSWETSKDEAYDFVNFQMRCVRPTEDVDERELDEFGPVSEVRQRLNFIFSRDDKNRFQQTLFNLKRFLQEHLQVDASGDASVRELLSASPNCQCLGTIQWRADKNDKEIMYSEIRKTAPVE